MDQNGESEEEIQMDIASGFPRASPSSLPAKSRDRYERAYKFFMDWCQENQTDSFGETVLLEYFEKLAEIKKPSTLWATYSMLRVTLNIERKIDISKYAKLVGFLKRKSHGYKPTRPKTLTFQQIREFLLSAPDDNYLFIKVGMIFRVMGGCSNGELVRIETSHVEDLKTALLVHIPDTETKTERQFVIGSNYYKICKKYMELRPPNLLNLTRFFLNYQKGKCTRQPIGVNKFSTLAGHIATFLKLPNPTSYTGQCWRRSSATVLVDSSGDITAVKRRRRWRAASVAGSYIAHSLNNKILHSEKEDNIEQGENINFEISGSTDNTFEGWTPSQTEALIDEYRKYPILYDVNHEDYSNLDLKNQSLRNIVDTLQAFRFGVTETEVINHWNSLRVKYIHMQQLQQFENSDLNEEPQFCQKLEFLKKYIVQEFIETVIRTDTREWEHGPDPLSSAIEIKEEIEDRLTEADQSSCMKRLREPDSCPECDAKYVKDENGIFGDFVASQLKKITNEGTRQDIILEIHNLLHSALKGK